MFNNVLPGDISVYAVTAATPFESSWACYYNQVGWWNARFSCVLACVLACLRAWMRADDRGVEHANKRCVVDACFIHQVSPSGVNECRRLGRT
jgi:hypothetical protein